MPGQNDTRNNVLQMIGYCLLNDLSFRRSRSLYAAGPEAYLDVFHDLSNDYVRVLIVGHNPALEELVEMLTGVIQIMPTCSLA